MKNLLIPFCFIFILVIGCNSTKNDDPAESVRIMKYSGLGPPPGLNSMSMAAAGTGKNSIANFQSQRLIIKTGTISIEVINYDTAAIILQTIVNKLNGYTVSSSTDFEDNYRKTGRIVVRIPSNTFEDILSEISALSSKVLSTSVQGNDVTEEYYDLSARLENKKRIEMRYREILKSAKSVEDILSVEKYLGETREEIESLEGRKRFLNDRITLSTITINLREPQPTVENEEESFWGKIGRGFRRGLYGFGDVFAYSITIIISSIPAIVLLYGMIFATILIIKRYRTRKSKQS